MAWLRRGGPPLTRRALPLIDTTRPTADTLGWIYPHQRGGRSKANVHREHHLSGPISVCIVTQFTNLDGLPLDGLPQGGVPLDALTFLLPWPAVVCRCFLAICCAVALGLAGSQRGPRRPHLQRKQRPRESSGRREPRKHLYLCHPSRPQVRMHCPAAGDECVQVIISASDQV